VSGKQGPILYKRSILSGLELSLSVVKVIVKFIRKGIHFQKTESESSLG
jgi:hypothetical protein